MHASAPQISRPHTAPSFLGFNRERFISDETADRVAKIASVAFRYTTLAAITVGSGYLSMGSFLVRSFIILSPVLGVLFAGIVIWQSARDILNNSLVSIGPANRQPMSLETISNKVDQTARVILWSFMIVGALSVGLAGGYCITGASLLYTAAQTGGSLALIKGLLNCTFALGFAIPFAQRALPNANRLYEGYDSVADELRSIIISLRNPSEENQQNARSFMQRIGQWLAGLFITHLDFDTLMNVADIIPHALFQSQFIAQLPSFSDEKIAAIIDRFPIILTIDFLAKNMPQEKFNAIVAPKLVSPITADQLAEMKTDIDAKEARLIALENAPNSVELSEEANQIASTINLYTRQVLQLRQFVKSLPEQDLPPQYAHLQGRINTARNLDHLANETLKRLTGVTDAKDAKDIKASTLKERLQRIQSRHIAQESAEDLEDPNYEVLGAYGFTLADFKALGGRLGVDLGNQEIQRTCEYLDQYGLQDRRGLIEHHILDAPDEGKKLNTEIIIERIVNFCQTRNNDEKIAPSPKEVEEASAAPEPALLSAPMPPQVVPQPRWARVSRVVNRIFHVTLTTSLMALQLYHLPISTSLGFIFRLTQNISNNRAFSTISRFSRPAPDYISQGFSERMRNLWGQIFINTWSLQIGPIGGFITGMFHADNTLSYLQQWRGRVQRVPSAA